jgi:hypothetical protein
LLLLPFAGSAGLQSRNDSRFAYLYTMLQPYFKVGARSPVIGD